MNQPSSIVTMAGHKFMSEHFEMIYQEDYNFHFLHKSYINMWFSSTHLLQMIAFLVMYTPNSPSLAEWLRELSFSRLECGVHDELHISSADWWDLLLPLA